MDKTGQPRDRREEARQTRLSRELRANLQRRKHQARSRRAGEADDRTDGIAASEETKKKM